MTASSVDNARVRSLLPDIEDPSVHLPATSAGSVPARACAFVVLALLCSWVPWGLLAATGDDPMAGPLPTTLFVLGGLGPGLAALALAWHGEGRAGLVRMGRSLRRWRLGPLGWLLLAPLPVTMAAVGVLVLLDRVSVEPRVGATVPLLPLFLLSGVVFGGLEEVGWRGYLQPLLQVRYRSVRAALLVGAVWSLWHAPLFLLEGTSQAATSPATFALGALALSVLFGWVWNASSGNLLLLVLLHAAWNGWYGATVQGLAPAAPDAGFGTVLAVLAALLALAWLLRVGGDLGLRPGPARRRGSN